MPPPPTLRSMMAAASWRVKARWAVRLITPWGIEWWLHVRPYRKALRDVEAGVVQETPPAEGRVEEAIRFLVSRGLSESQVRGGSMPQASLEYTAEAIADRLPADRPVLALHVGNFVGVSLCFFSWVVCDRHPDSVVVSVDPNIAHRGVEHPQAHALALLHRFGLLANNVVVPGYTLEHSLSDFDAATFAAEYPDRLACENVLVSLERLCGRRFDLVVLDGDHEEGYLAREVAAVRCLLDESGIVVFDDVTEGYWEGVAKVVRYALDDDSFVELGRDGRVAILQARTAPAPRSPGDR